MPMHDDPHSLDLRVRTLTTAAIALGVLLVAGFQAVSGGTVGPLFSAWGGIIIGVYFGSHVSMNGSGARAAVRQSILSDERARVLDAQAPD